MILSATLATVVIAPMALGWAWHDEQLYTGHTGIISQIQNGHYPPRHMTFPDLEYRYHYGFDLAAAAIATALCVRRASRSTFLTLSSWWYTWCLLWLLGDRLLGPGRGWITAVITLFGGGLPYLLALQDGYYVARFVMICEVGGVDLNPPVISYFFQHPWALGLPLALCTMLIVLDERKPRGARNGRETTSRLRPEDPHPSRHAGTPSPRGRRDDSDLLPEGEGGRRPDEGRPDPATVSSNSGSCFPLVPRYLSLAVLLSVLTISQVVVFASLAGAVSVAEVFAGAGPDGGAFPAWRRRWRLCCSRARPGAASSCRLPIRWGWDSACTRVLPVPFGPRSSGTP